MTKDELEVEFVKLQGEVVELKGMIMRQYATIMDITDKYYEIKKMLMNDELLMRND